MAVHDRAYRPYEGPLTRETTRFLVLPRYAFRDLVGQRFFWTGALAAAGPILVALVMIYLHHNIAAISTFKLDVKSLMPIDAGFFLRLQSIQGIILGFAVALLVGPGLVSSDLVHNGLPLYLARPFSRTEYVLGKGAVLVLLLSAATWIPLLGLFAFQAALGGMDWLREFAYLAPAIVVTCLSWIVTLTLVTLAVSAYTKRKVTAQGLLLGGFFLSTAIGQSLNGALGIELGEMVDLSAVLRATWASMFGVASDVEIPPLFGWISLAVLCLAALQLLHRKLRAYEVVR